MSGAHAAFAAAETQRRQREEERMSRYSSEEIDGNWEFKIVRSVTGDFGKLQMFYTVVEEEALSGWELLEKLDDNRIRFKRPTSFRKRDAMLPEGINPYRTRIGISEGKLAGLIISFTLLIVVVIAVFAEMSRSGQIPF